MVGRQGACEVEKRLRMAGTVIAPRHRQKSAPCPRVTNTEGLFSARNVRVRTHAYFSVAAANFTPYDHFDIYYCQGLKEPFTW
jgi:hypothetical protein